MERPPSPTSPSNPQAAAFLVTACAVTILLSFLVYVENFFFGSIQGIWMYRYFEEKTPFPRGIFLAALLVLALTVFIGGRLIHSRERTGGLIGLLGGVIVQILLRQAYPYSLGSIVISDRSNSFYTPSIQYSTLEILTNFGALAPTFPAHARTNMPGKILFYELLELFTYSPETMGYLIIVVSSLGGLLLYGICKKLFDDKKIAFYTLIMYALIPCKLFFFPAMNTITPVFMLLVFYLFLLFIERKTIRVAWLLGVAIFFTVLFEPSPLAAGLLLAGILLHALTVKKFTKQAAWKLFLHSMLAFVAVYLLFLLIFSFDLFRTFHAMLLDAADFNDAANRSYRIWFGENLKEFFYGVGSPVMIIFINLVTLMIFQWRSYKTAAGWKMEDVYTASLFLNFAALALLGINRGEVLRLWIYMAVLFQVPAAVYLAKIEKGQSLFFLFAATLVIQAILPLYRVAFLNP